MPPKPREMEKLILADGWVFKEQVGSHRQYVHPTKPGKVTIPFHKGKELDRRTELPSESRQGSNNAISSYRRDEGCYPCIRLVFIKRQKVTLSFFLI